MDPKRGVAAFFLTLIVATAAFAQEYGGVSDGPIELMTKHSRPFSGSVSLTTSRSLGYGATLGGTLVPDRIWFFASAEKSQPLIASRYGAPATDARLISQLGDRQNLATSFVRQSALTTSPTFTAIPSSFLSLHYTGIVSDNMFVTGSFSELKRSSPRN